MVVNKEYYENIPVGTHLFGRFVLRSVISACDTSAIYKCLCTWGEHKGKEVALKVTESSPKASLCQAQIIKEIKILSKIAHPNIIKAYDWFQDETFLAYSMEYIDAGTLDSILETSSGRSIQWSINLLMQLALGLKEIHRVGIIHRDVKPQNILVTADNQLKIADFGIAVRFNARAKEESEQITGTIDFVSPEYIRDGSFDNRSDIYAWGVIAYLMLTGHVPFEDESIVEALARKATEDPVSPRAFRFDIPEPLSMLILKALARDPNNRFQSCEDLLRSLMSFQTKPRSTNIFSPHTLHDVIKAVA